MAVDVGDRFSRGQVLAQLQSEQQRFAFDSASAELAEATATAQVARIDFERKSSLSGTGAVAQSEIDEAQRVNDEAVARLARLEARKSQAQDTLRDTRLYAPFAGAVTARQAEPSQVVSAGQTVFEVSSATSNLEAVISVPSNQKSRFKKGQSVLFARGDDTEISATVRQINAGASDSGLFEILVSVPGARRSGVAVGERGEILLEAPADRGIRLPLGAMRFEEDKTASVLVVDPETNTVSVRPVTVGQMTDEGVIISDGLSLGETVVAKGARLLRDGEEVRPTSIGPRQFSQ